jgi:hypothetical protein
MAVPFLQTAEHVTKYSNFGLIDIVGHRPMMPLSSAPLQWGDVPYTGRWRPWVLLRVRLQLKALLFNTVLDELLRRVDGELLFTPSAEIDAHGGTDDEDAGIRGVAERTLYGG